MNICIKTFNCNRIKINYNVKSFNYQIYYHLINHLINQIYFRI